MNIKDRFLEALGIKPRIPKAIVKNDAGQDPGELAEAAAKTREALDQPAQPASMPKPVNGITTDDLEDFRLRPDYIERRAAREAENQTKPQEFYVLRDISPR